MHFRSIHSECPLTAKTRLHYLSDSSLQFRLATPRDCESEERTNRNWFYVYALASLCLCSRQQQHQQQQQAKPLSVDAAFLPLSLHRHSNAKYAINKREPCEFLSKYTLPLSLSPSRTAYALSTCIHACMPTWLHVQLVYVRVCVVTHPTLLLSRGAHSAVLLLLASSYRYVTGQTNALIGWKYRTIQFLKSEMCKRPRKWNN